MFLDLYLRADDEAAMNAALAAAGLSGDEGATIDVIGTITRFVGGEPETLPGWHVNVRVSGGLSEDQMAALAPVLLPAPTQPYRVFL